MLKNKLAKENNVFDDKFDVNEYVKSELEEINKDIEKIKASVDEYVKNNKNIPEKSKNDK
ncbi:MAG: hypothetical protein LBC61_00945 [Candidatus Peribacteria bacterium]|jgi:hypothetical protein|nr:hypothetical protein [Candidatus Peribacteria bacterium]